MRIASVDLFAPVAIVAFRGLEASLRRDTRFRLFESYRSPEGQLKAVLSGNSKALPFLSAHQLGLGADFVPKDSGGWVWPDAANPEWDVLRNRAREFGLLCVLNWDRPHVEHPAYQQILPLLKARRVQV